MLLSNLSKVISVYKTYNFYKNKYFSGITSKTYGSTISLTSWEESDESRCWVDNTIDSTLTGLPFSYLNVS